MGGNYLVTAWFASRRFPADSSASIIPRVARFAAAQHAFLIQPRPEQKPQQFPRRVKPQLARGSHERMPVKNHNLPARRARELAQPLAQIQFFTRKQFIAESTDFPKRRRLAKNKRPGQ
jgi:hypothetical protein